MSDNGHTPVPDLNALHDHARAIGDLLEATYPTVRIDSARLIPHQYTEEVATAITLVVAEILQSWLDAGSERDVTIEELGEPMIAHVFGWTDHPDNAPKEA